jgi:hypothetical protein
MASSFVLCASVAARFNAICIFLKLERFDSLVDPFGHPLFLALGMDVEQDLSSILVVGECSLALLVKSDRFSVVLLPAP